MTKTASAAPAPGIPEPEGAGRDQKSRAFGTRFRLETNDPCAGIRLARIVFLKNIGIEKGNLPFSRRSPNCAAVLLCGIFRFHERLFANRSEIGIAVSFTFRREHCPRRKGRPFQQRKISRAEKGMGPYPRGKVFSFIKFFRFLSFKKGTPFGERTRFLISTDQRSFASSAIFRKTFVLSAAARFRRPRATIPSATV